MGGGGGDGTREEGGRAKRKRSENRVRARLGRRAGR